MKIIKVLLVTVALITFVGCSSDFESCVPKAKEALAKQGVPEDKIDAAAQQTCTPCKESKIACKAVMDNLK